MSIKIPLVDEKTKIKPKEDGQKHINVWSKGKTHLGQILSNFAQTPFRHPTHGFFASVEGYWYWCASGRQHEQMRRLHGASARSVGQQLESVPLPENEFRDMIRDGLSYKVLQTRAIREALADSHLPFEHYFVYGKDADVVVNQGIKHYWQLVWLQLLRLFLQKKIVAMGEQLLPDTQVRMADNTYLRAGDIEPGDELWDAAHASLMTPTDQVVLGQPQPASPEVAEFHNRRIAEDLQHKVDEVVRGEIGVSDLPF